MEQVRKKILVVATQGAHNAQAMAVWDGERLNIIEIRDINGDPGEWLPIMLKDMHEKIAKNWVVMVEDRPASFPENVINWNFDNTGPDGRINFQSCLDWYFTLASRGCVILKPHLKRYAITQGGANSTVAIVNDIHGRLVYNVDWGRFSAPHKAVLMCVAAAMLEEPLSERWINAFLETAPQPPEYKPALHIFKTMEREYKRMYNDFEASVAAMERAKHVRH